MKSLLTISVLAAGLLVGACATKPAPEVMAVAEAALDKKGKLELSGSGFAPNSDVVLLFTTKDGVESDIGYALDPAPKADANGNWKTTWSYGRFVKKKLVSEGDYSLIATDADFLPIATGKVTFK